MENHTAKHFVLQLGSLASLYLSLSFLLVLLFGYLNLQFPDPIEDVWQIENYSSMVRLGFAMVIVFFPTYLVLTRFVNQARRQDAKSSYLSLTKWLVYLSLLVGGAVLLGDLVTAINTFLNGEITTRFILKVLAVLVVVGSAFYYYVQDARGYWIKNEKSSIRCGVGATVAVVLALVAGLTSIATPAAVREQKIDDTQITDLVNIQSLIQNYLLVHNELPASLRDIGDGVQLPEAPFGRIAYAYEKTDQGFKLCATFANASQLGKAGYYSEPVMVSEGKDSSPTLVIVNPSAWDHAAGDVCFERVVR